MLLENRMMKSFIDELYSEIKIRSLSKPKNNSHIKLSQAIRVLVYNNYERVCDCVLVCVLEERRVSKMNDYFSRFHQYTSKINCFCLYHIIHTLLCLRNIVKAPVVVISEWCYHLTNNNNLQKQSAGKLYEVNFRKIRKVRIQIISRTTQSK